MHFKISSRIFLASSLLIYSILPIHTEDDLVEITCTKHDDCSAFNKPSGINSTCINKQCICVDNSTIPIQCTPTNTAMNNQIGGNCPCSIENSICSKNKFCLCKENFTASTDKRRCLPKMVPLGDVCENDSQCNKNDTFSYCEPNNKTCTCNSNFAINKGSCHSLVVLGQTCEDDDECLNQIPKSICVRQKYCMCNFGFIAKFDNTECLPEANFGENCSETTQCKRSLGEGALCEHQVCTCAESFYNVTINTGHNQKILCAKRKEIGDMCATNEDCHEIHKAATEQTMECFLIECICRSPGYDQKDQYCIKRSTAVQITPLATVVLFCFAVVVFRV